MDLDNWIANIRSGDPATFEDAYWGERPTGPEVVPRLVTEMLRSPDGYTRGKFLELLGEMGDASIVPVLTAELSHPDSVTRFWAVTALEEIGTVEAIQAARECRENHPDEW